MSEGLYTSCGAAMNLAAGQTQTNCFLEYKRMKIIKRLLAIAILGLLTCTASAQSWIVNGLVAYYPFNGNANDTSGNGYNATSVTATLTEDRFGTSNHAYLFSTGTEKIETAFPGISGSNPRTITLWVKRSNSIQEFPAFSFSQGAGNGHEFIGIFNRNQTLDQCNCWPTVYIGAGVDTGNAEMDYNTSFDTTNWEFYAWIVPSKPSPAISDIQIYKNGTLLTNQQFFYNNANLPVNTDLSHLILGGNLTLANGDGIGAMDDVRIYNRALSSNEVAQLYAIESAPTRPFMAVSTALTFSKQSGSNVVGTVATTASPTQVKLASKDLLAMLALDEYLQGNWPSNSFPAKATLALAGHRFVVVNGTNLLLNVSDLLSLEYGDPQVTSGKRNTVTGLASTSAQKLQLASIEFDDTAINGGNNLHFYLYGILKLTTTDTVPVNGIYTETQAIGKTTVVGDGFVDEVPFTCTGTFSATGKSPLQL